MSDCIEWTKGCSTNGYGQVNVISNGKHTTARAHRVAWEQRYGEIPKGLIVRHKCDNRLCINTDHLELGTSKQNTQDAVARNRMARGERSGLSKLTTPQVLEIKRELAQGKTMVSLARRFGVTHTAIKHIAVGRTWSWLTLSVG